MKGIHRITIIETQADGSTRVGAEATPRKKKRKRSKGLKSSERNARLVIEAMQTYADELDARHRSSSRKKKDGWLRDMNWNVAKAGRKATKKLRKLRLF